MIQRGYSVDLDSDAVEIVESLAARHRSTPAQVVHDAVRYYLRRHREKRSQLMDLLCRYPGGIRSIGDDLGVGLTTLYKLARGLHARQPFALIESIANAPRWREVSSISQRDRSADTILDLWREARKENR